MDAHAPQEVVLHGEQVEQHAVARPGEAADAGAGDGVEHEVVRRGDDGDEDDGRVGDAHGEAGQAARAGESDAQAHEGECEAAGAAVLRGERDRADGQADEQGVAKVQRGHGGVLVAEFVLRPHRRLAGGAVHRVDEAKGARFLADWAGDVGVGEQARWHAGPEGEDDEGEEVADGHGAAAGGIQTGSGGRARGFAKGLGVQREVEVVAGGGVEEEPDEEEDGAGDVDEGVDAVGPVEEEGVLEEPVLDVEFVEEVEALLEVDDLEGMLAGDVDGGFDEGYGREGAAELVYLKLSVWVF